MKGKPHPKKVDGEEKRMLKESKRSEAATVTVTATMEIDPRRMYYENRRRMFG